MVGEGREQDGVDEPETRAGSSKHGRAAHAVAPLFSCHACVTMRP